MNIALNFYGDLKTCFVLENLFSHPLFVDRTAWYEKGLKGWLPPSLLKRYSLSQAPFCFKNYKNQLNWRHVLFRWQKCSNSLTSGSLQKRALLVSAEHLEYKCSSNNADTRIFFAFGFWHNVENWCMLQKWKGETPKFSCCFAMPDSYLEVTRSVFRTGIICWSGKMKKNNNNLWMEMKGIRKFRVQNQFYLLAL